MLTTGHVYHPEFESLSIFYFRLSGIRRVQEEFLSPSVQVNLSHCAPNPQNRID